MPRARRCPARRRSLRAGRPRRCAASSLAPGLGVDRDHRHAGHQRSDHRDAVSIRARPAPPRAPVPQARRRRRRHRRSRRRTSDRSGKLSAGRSGWGVGEGREQHGVNSVPDRLRRRAAADMADPPAAVTRLACTAGSPLQTPGPAALVPVVPRGPARLARVSFEKSLRCWCPLNASRNTSPPALSAWCAGGRVRRLPGTAAGPRSGRAGLAATRWRADLADPITPRRDCADHMAAPGDPADCPSTALEQRRSTQSAQFQLTLSTMTGRHRSAARVRIRG